ncbi:PREDICTED: gephyrin-like [Trachymyrmex septentrionalis]|uniref:gephyrin-like n=1 Tax=Trachymyrmex septentrionalis TaxID=34720 RepID=UPI00084F3E36|nr:PREDICTED: gephyrin-like [Trachymyrmex septentrionalis]
MYGPLCENAIMSLMTNVTLILKIVHLMNVQDEKMCSIKNDDTLDKAFNTNNNNDNSDKVSLHSTSENETKNILIQNLSERIYKRQKQTVMMSVKDALRTMDNVLDDEYEDKIEIVETNNAYGRVLVDNIVSSADVPFYNTSTKHGYAVLVSDGKSTRRVLKHFMFAEISIVPGTCVRVRSGDPIPNGVTAVVTLANTKILKECSDDDDDYFNINDKEYEIEVLVAPEKNENIRYAGCEIKCRDSVLQGFTRIGTVELGILKLCGINSVSVMRIPSVGLLSIGDKLEEPGYTSTLKRIYDCNSITLISLLKENGYNPVDLGISAYQLKAIIKNIEYALDKVNLLVIMGHANDNDLLKPILREYFKAVIHFGRVEMKPGKSTTFATCIFNHKLKFFLCMSANPATIPIVAHIFLLPFLNGMDFEDQAYEPKPNIQTCIMTTHELHRRPTFSWTTLHWSEKETFPRTLCSKKQHQNILKYQEANALLMLPQRTSYESKIDAAFVSAMFLVGQNSSIESSIVDQADLKRSINFVGELASIEFSKCDKKEVKEKLISLTDQNKGNVIILIGEISVVNNVVYEAIEEIIDKNISKDLTTLISSLREELTYSFNRPICGIRKDKFIISICDSNVIANTMINLEIHESYASLIFPIMRLMHIVQDKKIDNTENRGPDEAFCNNSNNDISDKSLSLQYVPRKKNDEILSTVEYLPHSKEQGKFLQNVRTNDHVASEYQQKNMLITERIYKKQRNQFMLPVKKALKIIRLIVYKYHLAKEENVQIKDAYGRILANKICSSVNVPLYNISAKHGYAVLASDGKGIRRVLKAHPTFAEISIIPGICVRVRSGDPIPNGATAVVTLENTKILEECIYNDDDYFNIDDKEYQIEVLVTPKKNENIRNAGCEMQRTQCICNKFTRIGSAELGILTLCGINSVPVIQIPSVGLLSISSELKKPGNASILGRIHDCNKIIVSSLLKKNNYDPVNLGISAHKLDDMVNKIKNALDKVDILVIMGRTNDKDLLKPILKKYFNAMIYFGCVKMKPGKSTIFATCTFKDKIKFLLCMSANPTTVPVVTHVLLLPFLNEMYRSYLTKPINIQACINTKHELHSRPKFFWTTLRWTETEMFPRAYCLQNQHQNIMNYQKGNALLMLPQCLPNQSILDATFVPTMFLG